MKQPKLSDVKLDKRGTKVMRASMANTKKVKITINFDSDILNEIKQLADNIGSPYQTFLNNLVRKSLEKKKEEDGRLDKLEKEIKALKKKIA